MPDTNRYLTAAPATAYGVADAMAVLSTVLPPLTPPATAEAWLATAAETRAVLLALLMSGHPEGVLDAPFAVEWGETIDTDQGYRIRKLRYEGYPGLWAPALVYEPYDGEHLPAVLNPEGHHGAGNALPIKQARCINLAKRGMVALSCEFLGMGELGVGNPHSRVEQLNAAGVYGVGVFYLIMKRALDILLGLPRVDATRVAMTGCSGGGWQTILLSSLDTRITAAIPVAGHSPAWQRMDHVPDIGDHEQLPPDFCATADYDTLTALMAPRPCLLIYNHYDDCCFQSERTVVSVYARVQPIYDLLGCPEALAFHDCLYPRSHNYDAGNREQLYRFLARHFNLPAGGTDIPCEDELRTEQELAVGLPADNATLLTLARDAMVRCRRQRATARQQPADTRRAQLAALLHLPALQVDRLDLDAPVAGDGWHTRHGLARVGPWTLPVAEISGPAPCGVAIVLHDRGRTAEKTAALIDAALRQQWRVYAVDLWGCGDAGTSWQYPLLLETAGLRPLGVQVAQVLALAQHLGAPCHLLASPLTTPVVALAAAALAPAAFASLTTVGLMPSLDRIIDWPIDYGDCPSLFCRDLLTAFDIDDLLALAAPVPIRDDTRGMLCR